jgi:flagellar biosynthesis protein FlhG
MQKVASEWLNSFKSQEANLVGSKRETPSKKSRQFTKAQTIAVTGGKGGVGKTSVALKISQQLSANAKVLLIDCDYNLSNTAIRLGLPVKADFISLLSSEKSFDECLYKDGNFHLLSACNGDLDLFDADFQLENFIVDILTAHESEYDYIILDCPAGLSKGIMTLNAYCNHRLMVVTPDKSSLTDSYSLIKILNHRYGIKENHLVVNMFRDVKQYQKIVTTFCETIETFLSGRTQILGGVPFVDRFEAKFSTKNDGMAKNSIDQHFTKIAKNISERLGTANANLRLATLEQDVH